MKHLPTTLLLAAGACAPVKFANQEIDLRHDAEADILEVTLTYEGLTPRPAAVYNTHDGTPPKPLGGEARLEEASTWLRRLAAGERVFILVDWPFVFDLDEPGGLELPVGEEGEKPSAVDEQRLRTLVDSIEMLEAQLYIDEETGRLAARQHLRWSELAAGLATINDGLNAALREDLEKVGEGSVNDQELSPESRDLLRAHVRDGRPWIAVVKGALEIRIPITPADFAKGMERPDLASAAEVDLDFARPMLKASSVTADESGIRVHYAPNEEGVIHVPVEHDDVEYDDQLEQHMRAAGLVE